MIDVFIVAAGLYGALLCVMYVGQRKLLYSPDTTAPSRERSGAADMDEVHFETQDGLNLFAWLAPPRIAQQPWVVIFHGNAGSVALREGKARVFMEAGYGVMLVEYRGYGGNPGKPDEAGLFADARAALNYLAQRDANGAGLVLYGESLGTGVATAMAAEAANRGRPVKALILEAPFTSAVDVAAGRYPFLPARLMLKDHFDTLSRICDVRTPVQIVHGAKDRTVPQRLGRKLFAAVREPKEALWIDGAQHCDLFDFGAGEAMVAFLKRHLKSR